MDDDLWGRLADAENPQDVSRLHPDLREHLVRGQSGLLVLRHPLVTSIMPLWPVENERYAAKRRVFDKAVEERDWPRALSYLEGSWPLEYLAKWAEIGDVSLDELRDLLPSVWARSEPDDTSRRWLALWRRAAAPGRVEQRYREDEQPDAEWVLESLDERFPGPGHTRLPVFRGQHTVGEKRGIAWSLDPEVAELFACRFNRSDTGYVLEGTVEKRRVLGYVTSRGESEIITDARHVSVTGHRAVPVEHTAPRREALAEDAIRLSGSE